MIQEKNTTNTQILLDISIILVHNIFVHLSSFIQTRNRYSLNNNALTNQVDKQTKKSQTPHLAIVCKDPQENKELSMNPELFVCAQRGILKQSIEERTVFNGLTQTCFLK